MAKNKGGNFNWGNIQKLNLLVILHEQGFAKDCAKFSYYDDTDAFAKQELYSNPFYDAHRYDRDNDLWWKANRWYASNKIVWEGCASTSVPKTVRMATLIAG